MERPFAEEVLRLRQPVGGEGLSGVCRHPTTLKICCDAVCRCESLYPAGDSTVCGGCRRVARLGKEWLPPGIPLSDTGWNCGKSWPFPIEPLPDFQTVPDRGALPSAPAPTGTHRPIRPRARHDGTG